jgi:hypothetical protein
MTTDAERALYYQLAREGAGQGAIVELGAWLGASTAYIAAGVRDSGVETKAHVYDRFLSKPGHVAKVEAFYAKHGGSGDMPLGSCFEQFKANLGPLLAFVEPHPGEIASIEWGDQPIAVLITDAPKRVREISAVLTRLRHALRPGSVMAWQDFCHFPSYEIPACLYRLRSSLRFEEAVVPGTTLAFRLTSNLGVAEVSIDALGLHRWSPQTVAEAWEYWLNGRVAPEKASLFRCGAAMFLCDIGEPDRAVTLLREVFAADLEAILPKWQYLHRTRANLVTRYQPLFDFLAREGALSTPEEF